MSRRLPGGSEVFSVMDRLHRRRAGRTPQIGEKNTPTGVGKTTHLLSPTPEPMKHPHGRGEDLPTLESKRLAQETPPRAWGRPVGVPCRKVRARNTPTGVGKTHSQDRVSIIPWKHPHGRGEDGYVSRETSWKMETPPRAWGRPRKELTTGKYSGNTPTGVGKTAVHAPCAWRREKHPHGRGEDCMI